MGDFVYQIFDCGGSRGQRKKWFPFFWNVDAIIFPVDMSSYDQLPVEGDVAEALGLFEMICSLTIFKNTFIILFFNKVDLLRRKLARIPFDCYHSDFDADPLSLEAVKAYFTRKFLSLNRSEKNVKVCFADMVDDTSLGESAFAALEECMKLRKEKDDKKKEIPSALNSEIEDIAG
jgi:guanine nucleotide-binding protein subunit alpha